MTRFHLRNVLPLVDAELSAWRRLAAQIPDDELRRQALSSLEMKRFHCEGGSVFAAWEPSEAKSIVRFVVAFQTISDYLDNLADRVGVFDVETLRRLHEAMLDAVSLEPAMERDYYRRYPLGDDGGYLASLVAAARLELARFPRAERVADDIRRLVELYIDLQAYKHVEMSARVSLLERWFAQRAGRDAALKWWEFAAASGSTLGVFALVAESARERPVEAKEDLLAAYFPWICGLHILLDYYIDQEEDRKEEDLNLVSFYQDAAERASRMAWFLSEALQRIAALQDGGFHRAVVEGLLGLYLSDPKVREQGFDNEARALIRQAGWRARLTHAYCRRWRRRQLPRPTRQREAMTS